MKHCTIVVAWGLMFMIFLSVLEADAFSICPVHLT
uniref:Uncharacterized protein n=1 Tax=uncultured Desulfobacterium sp. TaxID=201089 RepID=E1YLS2_9BACT|nr:unknown protein [uncultured Desulfobacterium sp.]